MRWGMFLLGLVGTLVFGVLAGVGLFAALSERPERLLTIVRAPIAIVFWFFMAMTSTAAMIVAFDPPSKKR